jgi:hypothetical protein
LRLAAVLVERLSLGRRLGRLALPPSAAQASRVRLARFLERAGMPLAAAEVRVRAGRQRCDPKSCT